MSEIPRVLTLLTRTNVWSCLTWSRGSDKLFYTPEAPCLAYPHRSPSGKRQNFESQQPHHAPNAIRRWVVNRMVSRLPSSSEIVGHRIFFVFQCASIFAVQLLIARSAALILQHFERGPKLTDSSNRYQHTCRSCGEKFPKGRIDSLTTHLVKKCPALSLHDRKKALMELNNMPSVAEGSRGDNSMGQGLEMHDQQTWTALETLAEVSRLHMEEKPGDHSVGHTHAGGSRASEPPRMARLEMHETFTWDNPPVSYDKRLSRDKKRKSLISPCKLVLI